MGKGTFVSESEVALGMLCRWGGGGGGEILSVERGWGKINSAFAGNTWVRVHCVSEGDG